MSISSRKIAASPNAAIEAKILMIARNRKSITYGDIQRVSGRNGMDDPELSRAIDALTAQGRLKRVGRCPTRFQLIE